MQLEEKIIKLKNSLQVNYPNIESIWNLSGDYFKIYKNYKQAEVCFLKSIEINPNSYIAYVNLGFVNQETGNIEKAINYYQKAIELSPNNHIPYSNLGMMLHNQNKFIEARNYYLKSLEINPNNPSIQQNLQNANNAIKLYNLE